MFQYIGRRLRDKTLSSVVDAVDTNDNIDRLLFHFVALRNDPMLPGYDQVRTELKRTPKKKEIIISKCSASIKVYYGMLHSLEWKEYSMRTVDLKSCDLCLVHIYIVSNDGLSYSQQYNNNNNDGQ